jgi:hypothetical protein
MRSNLRLLPLALFLLVALLALPSAASADGTGTTVALSATQGKLFDGPVANFSEIDDRNYDSGPSATIEWGDGTSSFGRVTGDRQAQKWSVAGSHVYTKAGNFQVVVTLEWHDANQPRKTVAAGPISVASGLAPIGTTVRTPFGKPFAGDIGSFRDDRGGQPDRTKFSAKVDWGDGTAPTPAEIEGAGGTTFRLVSGHAYAQAGYYTVKATVTSTDGAAATVVETTMIVTGDPKPSFTTNGAPCANVPVTFSSTTATSPGSPIVNYTWKIEDPTSAFGQPNGGKPFDTLAKDSLTHTFVYSSVEMALGTGDTPPPSLPLRLHRNPVNVTLTVTDATGETRSATQTVKFADDNYKPTAAAPTPKGCGARAGIGSVLTMKDVKRFKVSRLGGFKIGAGCRSILDCLAQVQIVQIKGGKKIALGTGSAFMRTGASGNVTVGLNSRGESLLESAGKVQAQLVITSLTGGVAKTVTRPITLAR